MNLEKLQKYIEKYRQRLRLLIYNDGFQTEVSNIRASWSVPPNGFDSLENGVECIKEQSSNNRESAFLDEVNRLVTKYNLPSNWETAVMCYVLTGDENLMLASVAMPSAETISMKLESNEMKVALDKFTSLEDIITIWPEVKKMQRIMSKDKPQKQKPIDNLDRYVRAKQLIKTERSYDKVADVLSQEFDEILTEYDVSQYIYKLKQLSESYYGAHHA